MTGILDCWVEIAGKEWVETFVADNCLGSADGIDVRAKVARAWCVSRRLAHKIFNCQSVAEQTILRESQRRIIGYYKPETFISRSTELKECSDDLLNRLRKSGSTTVSDILESIRGDVQPELANLAVCELLRRGKIDGNLTADIYGGRSRLSVTTGVGPHCR